MKRLICWFTHGHYFVIMDKFGLKMCATPGCNQLSNGYEDNYYKL